MDVNPQAASSAVRWHQKLLGHIADTVTVVGADGVPMWTSASSDDSLGYESDFWQSANLFDLVHPDEANKVGRWLDELLAQPGGEVSGELRLRRADGTYGFVGFRCVNLLDDSDVGGIVIAARSVDDEVRAREHQARQNAHFESQLAGHSALIADVSHEMRAPIHAVLGLTELLLDDGEMSLDQRRDLETVRREADSLKVMVDELLDLSKLGADRVELQSEPFSPTGLLDEVARAFVPQAHGKGLGLTVQMDPTVPRSVVGDAFRVRQILTNLVSNAVKYTDAGAIVLALDTTDTGDLLFKVIDTGRGIPDSVRESIFEPYTQARAGDVATGTGIGLAIVRRLAEMMGGTVWLESVVAGAPGESSGTTFFCELPLPEGRRSSDRASAPRQAVNRTAGSVSPAEASADQRGSGTQAERNVGETKDDGPPILVVDDSEVNRMLASSQLRRLGYEPVLASSAAEALDVLATRPPAAILMDWHMPDVDGLEATRRIRSSGASWSDLPIVAVTASALVDDRQTCLDAGMDDYLSKPVSLADLDGMLRRWVPTEDPNASQASEHLDGSVVDALREELGDDGIVCSIVGTFIGELDRLGGVIESALDPSSDAAAPETEVIRRAGHTVKSTAAMLGANRLATAAAALEQAAVGDTPQLGEPIECFRLAAVEARSALVALADELGGNAQPADPQPVGSQQTSSQPANSQPANPQPAEATS